MAKYRFGTCCVLLAAFFLIGGSLHARVPDALSHALKLRHFNLYGTPCIANTMVLRDLNGAIVDLGALRGKVVILNFWRIDCPPCTYEKPILERIRRKYAHRGLEVVAVNLFDDYHRMRSFTQGTGFGFTICGDPNNRFSVRRQSLPRGAETTFVVNSRSEAIYEVPALPTTYVIDRRGWVVGNAIGIVNWEEEPFGHLLEYLLGPAPQRLAQAVQASADAAQRGETPDPTPRPVGPRREAPVQATQGAISPPLPPNVSNQPTTGLTGTPGITQGPVTGRHPLVQSPREGTRQYDEAPVSRPQQTQKPRVTPSKRKPQQATRPPDQSRTPKPFSPPIATGSVPAPSLPWPTPNVAQSEATGPTVSSGAIGSSRPPLPAAIPYVRPRLEGPPRPAPSRIIPEANGTVTAQIPQRRESSFPSGSQPVEPEARSIVPAPGTAYDTNPIDNFILDSFKRSDVPGQSRPEALRPTQTEQASPQPADSMLEQVGRDFRNLGAGISEVFSRMWPGKR